MTAWTRNLGIFLLFTTVIVTASCGVKGPPLPPIPQTPQSSDAPEPGPTVSPTPRSTPTQR